MRKLILASKSKARSDKVPSPLTIQATAIPFWTRSADGHGDDHGSAHADAHGHDHLNGHANGRVRCRYGHESADGRDHDRENA